jgi:hypothetical protein
MKLCQCCGQSSAPDAKTCGSCGEASWLKGPGRYVQTEPQLLVVERKVETTILPAPPSMPRRSRK